MMKHTISSQDIANLVGGIMVGPEVFVDAAVPISELSPKSISFVTKYSENMVDLINASVDSVVICAEEYRGKLQGTHILTDNPRLSFLRTIQEYFTSEKLNGISKTAIIHASAIIGNHAYIGENVYIGPNVVIGEDCEIHHNVVITNGTRIGRGCSIKSNTVIGEAGFGFEYGEFGRPEHFPHIGKVIIGDNVWIGSCTTIERATLDVTFVDNHVKIDDKVQVGHNCKVGENTLIMAGVVLCGGCKVGRSCWIAPNTTVKEKIHIKDNVYTGLGSVIINDVEENTVVVGNPAKILRRR